MNIAIIVRKLSGRGGMEAVIQTVAQKAQTAQIPMKVWAMGQLDDTRWLENIAFQNINIDQGTGRRLQLRAKLPLYIAALANMLAHSDTDVILATDPVFVEAAHWARKFVKRSVTVLSWIHFSLDKVANAPQLLHADGHLAISSGLAQQLANIGVRAPISIVYNPLPETQRPRAGTIQANPDQFLYVGRLAIAQKRLDLMFHSLQTIERDWSLILVGDGPDRPALEALAQELRIRDRIQFLGWHANPWDLIMPRAVLLSSDFEGFPMALIESLSRGIPVIATNCPTGPSDIIYDGRNGILTPPGSVEAFRTAIDRALQSSPWTWNAQQIQNNAVERFNATHVFSSMLQGIRDVIPL